MNLHPEKPIRAGLAMSPSKIYLMFAEGDPTYQRASGRTPVIGGGVPRVTSAQEGVRKTFSHSRRQFFRRRKAFGAGRGM